MRDETARTATWVSARTKREIGRETPKESAIEERKREIKGVKREG